MTILDKITTDKQTEVDSCLSHITDEMLEKNGTDKRIPLDFREKLLSRKDLSIIAEVKKASPSKGLIREDFHPISIARSYEDATADCLSVLTEKKYFQGDPEYLRQITKEVSLPLLRKDFMVDYRQVRESYEMGADAILLIVGVLSYDELIVFKGLAASFGLTCLVEVHSSNELDIAMEAGFDLIGINNRDLKTFQTDIKHSIALKQKLPSTVCTVSESGIHKPDDCRLLRDAGFDAILVGESLMRKSDPGRAITELMEEVWQ